MLVPWMGSQACFGVLPASRSGRMRLTPSMGSANAMPAKFCVAIAVLMPMTSPFFKSMSGPPELPVLIEAPD